MEKNHFVNQKNPACPECGCNHLYKKKDFNQALGCLVILIGAIFVPITFMPKDSNGINFLLSLRSGCSLMPKTTGSDGPYISKSSNPTFRSRSLKDNAKFTATVDFPTPPLPLEIAMICFIPDIVDGPC